MDIPRLIDDWAQRDPQKQVAAWQIIRNIIQPVVRAALHDWHQPRDLLDDREQEFFVYLLEECEKGHDQFAGFHGRSMKGFRGYFRRIALRLANRRLLARTCHDRLEREAARGAPPGDHVTGSEADILARLAEIEPQLTRTERETLEQLVASASAGLGTQPGGSENGGIHEQPSASTPPTGPSGLKRRSRLLKKLRGLLFGKRD